MAEIRNLDPPTKTMHLDSGPKRIPSGLSPVCRRHGRNDMNDIFMMTSRYLLVALNIARTKL
jgi:hypothetical protein